jgi:hypothetical protein
MSLLQASCNVNPNTSTSTGSTVLAIMYPNVEEENTAYIGISTSTSNHYDDDEEINRYDKVVQGQLYQRGSVILVRANGNSHVNITDRIDSPIII